MSIFTCGSSFPDKVAGSIRKKKPKMKQKLNHILKKARPKKGELHSWQGSDEGKKKQKCFSSMSRTHYAFSRRGSKPKSAGWYFVLSSHCTMGNPGSNFSQWACRFMLHPDLLILWFSTTVIPCSCLDAVDLYQTPHLALSPRFHERLRPMLR